MCQRCWVSDSNTIRQSGIKDVHVAVVSTEILQNCWTSGINACRKRCARVLVHYAVEDGPSFPKEQAKRREPVPIYIMWIKFVKASRKHRLWSELTENSDGTTL